MEYQAYREIAMLSMSYAFLIEEHTMTRNGMRSCRYQKDQESTNRDKRWDNKTYDCTVCDEYLVSNVHPDRCQVRIEELIKKQTQRRGTQKDFKQQAHVHGQEELQNAL